MAKFIYEPTCIPLDDKVTLPSQCQNFLLYMITLTLKQLPRTKEGERERARELERE